MNPLIETASHLPSEVRTAAELQRLLMAFDLSGLEWADHVVVQTSTRPHSHPVITINTRRTGDALLAVYLHEQLHWWMGQHARAASGIEATCALWPSTPSPEEGGARNETSTRLHLFVCFLEHQAMRVLVGSECATTVIDEQISEALYPWVRRQVLERPTELAELCTQYGLWPPRLEQSAICQ